MKISQWRSQKHQNRQVTVLMGLPFTKWEHFVMAKSKQKLVNVGVKDRSAISQQQVAQIRNVLATAGFELGTLHGYTTGTSNGVTDCGEHSCVGFDPGGGNDCSTHGSRCPAEACDTQACSGHACDSNSCSTEACSGHICDIHEKDKGQVFASMTKSSPTFAALQSALAKIPSGIGGGISLSSR